MVVPMPAPSGRSAGRLAFSAAFALVGVAVLLAPNAGALKKVFRVQLDADKPIEIVRVQERRCKESYPCTQLVLRDGDRRVKLTRIGQRPRFPYHWTVTNVRFRDLTGDGFPEIIWDLFTVGGTGSSPSLKGAHKWDGRVASRIFRFANGRKPPRGYESVDYVTWRIVAGANGGLPEIETRESLHKRDDGTCCPSAFRVTRHRWNGTRIAPVPGSVVVEAAGA